MSRIIEVDSDKVIFFCESQESDFFDFKSKEVSGKKIQQTAVSFANSEGGEILIGVQDDKHEKDVLKRWDGFEKIEGFNSIIQALSELNPSIDFYYNFLRLKGQTHNYILHVTIRKDTSVHKTASGDIYVRRGAQSLKLSLPNKILELTHSKGITTEEDSIVADAIIDDLVDSKVLADFLSQLPVTDPDPLNFLLKEHLVDTNNWTPKVAALLLFSETPSSIIPRQCAVRVVRYDTIDEDIDRDNLQENISLEGPLFNLFSSTFYCIKELLERTRVWTINGFVSAYYPDETLWEILVNALIHRDYSISDNVLISIFSNRIEFKSPGRLPGLVTVDNILENRFSRNPKIVRLLSKFKNAPNKDLGEGMNTAFQKMAAIGLKSPEIYEDGNYVKMIIRHVPSQGIEKTLLEFVIKHGSINNRQAKDLSGLDSAEKVTSLFSKMRDQNILKRLEGTSGTASKWVNTK
ncbi:MULTISPECIES: RNA-binding domain-containing protein [Enterobacterales]|uniref:RNA-binding domain-containing protein n=1 Tax=Yersinia proxima TaxID=2890316 RepID=A0ABW9ETX1_9GAMM|nr:RNA-binding domain-containing protein [Pantoea agglomerans]